MTRKRVYYKREFLNKEDQHTLASILFKVEAKDMRTRGALCGFYTEFVIADCYRQISLDFETCTEVGLDNSIYKLNLLHKRITEFRKHFLREAEKLKKARELRKKNGLTKSDNLWLEED